MRALIRVTAFVVVLALLAACGADRPLASPFPAATGRGSCAVDTERDVGATMRDGVVLRADVYRPRTSDPVPVLLMRTQYGKSGAQTSPERYEPPDWFASHCYLVVVQDVRGQGSSGGVFSEFTNDMADGYDTVEWAAGLPGANGKVAMYGSSYVGATQWLAAVTAPPHLVTIAPANTASDYYDGWTYEGGEFRLAFVQPWAIESIALGAAQNRRDGEAERLLRDAGADPTRWLNFRPQQDLPPMQPHNPAVAPWYFDWVRHNTRDAFWQQVSIRDRYPAVRIPVLHFEGWYDAFLAGGVENFAGMVAHGANDFARTNQRLVIGPWDHVAWGRPDSEPAPMLKDIGAVGNSPINELMLAWFDHFLKGVDNGVAGKPRVDYFTMGANTWKTATNWPLPQTQWINYYLSGVGGSADRDGKLLPVLPGPQPPDTYTYDPLNPAPSLGGHSCCGAKSGPQGPYDQTPVEQRSDVLVYTGDPVAHDTEITGAATVTLWAQSSAVDTDFTAKLVVVKPDGAAINLNNGILRASFRDSLSAPTPIVPGQAYQYRIQIWPTSYQLKPGDRVRVEISSSDYPQFAPNPNTGAPFGRDAASVVAAQTILHDPAHPSSITLPVIAN
ncbi:CocE/NonD family hydrolase [Mycolicibacterium mucogenicum]|uniref:CocE/NonD family hydrolase n=1 Tax=Mycolicibacterium mucogenicum DSM 44124 TaxID=1226753 RepID=A0A8H2JGR9_MYCMU|nr:CocE/NonD family hydrolase [Mycolicibacterium mucogenicum]KAB7760836.1 peptidase [Mycolicibacterium mucogenicum DSM 44124]QPG67865.1 CocE/NonD family hydrolase [Mycolicibacterium mucogenicum DSM 44124]